MTSRKLSDLLKGSGASSQGSLDPVITSLAHDSRKVKRGSLFIAVPGAKQDGRAFIPQALSAGAVAVMSVPPFEASGVARIEVPEILCPMARVAAQFYDHPSRAMTMVGVTGTNGKTTITYLLENILRAANVPSGVLGTISYRYPGHDEPAPNTTPLATDLQETLAAMREAKVRTVVMEVSSHALALHRVDHIDFDVAVFTNLTQDHLDFHGTMENYFSAKAALFQNLDRDALKKSKRFAIINRDDPYGARLENLTRAECVSYGLSPGTRVRAEDVRLESRGTSMTLVMDGRKHSLLLPLVGNYNVHNALAAAGAAQSLGLEDKAILRGLTEFSGVPGRLERIQEGQPFTVVVDYAHTEDALRRVLSTLQEIPHHRILTLFGCGGDRDRTKRPRMGRAAAELSDWVFVTSDNPRSEDPAAIAAEVERGIQDSGKKNYSVVLDRGDAIVQALRDAKPDDIVLLAGKGHETYQILKDRTIPFDDRATAREILRKIREA